MEAFDFRYSIPDEIDLDIELSQRGYREFIKIAWRWVEPSKPFQHNWHIDAIADHLEAVVKGEIKRLVINIPPGSTKSISVSVMFPAWVWTFRPGVRFVYGSYNDDLSLRDAKRCRRLIDSDWYQDRWGRVFRPHWADNWEAGRFSNDKGGSRKTTSIAGGVTGEHADIQVADDPHKPYDLTGSLSIAEKSKETVLEWWRSTMSTRTTDITKTARIVMMQRLADGDLAGEMIKSGLYEVLCLPMEFESKRKCFTSIGFEDPRKKENEILDPKRWPRKQLEILKQELGPRAAQAQLQQNPAPREGTIFKDKHFSNRYSELLLSPNATLIQSWDCTFSDSGDSYVCGQIWANDKSFFYLINQIRERLTFTKTIRAIKHYIKEYPEAYTILIEKKANGAAIIDALENEGINGLYPIDPKESKAARASAVEPYFEMGKVMLPHESIAPWIVKYESEMKNFTGQKSEINDQVDATTQALSWFMKNRSDSVKNALDNMDDFAKWM
jgi:predicted phage terminase large subunit-like protein